MAFDLELKRQLRALGEGRVEVQDRAPKRTSLLTYLTWTYHRTVGLCSGAFGCPLPVRKNDLFARFGGT